MVGGLFLAAILLAVAAVPTHTAEPVG